MVRGATSSMWDLCSVACRESASNGHKSATPVFAYLLPELENIDAALAALTLSGASVACVAPCLSAASVHIDRRPSMHSPAHPVELKPLLANVKACVSYGAEGTVATFLLAGVQKLLMPAYSESYLAARRVLDFGAGVPLCGAQSAQTIATALRSLVDDDGTGARARSFAHTHCGLGPDRSAEHVVVLAKAALEGPTRGNFEQSRYI